MVRRARYAVAGVLFAAATLPVGVMIVWVLAWGRIAEQAAVDLGLVALLCGMAGWIVLPARRDPLARLVDGYVRQVDEPGRLVRARNERLDLEASWDLPAYLPPHELPVKAPWWGWWDTRFPDGGEPSDRDW